MSERDNILIDIKQSLTQIHQDMKKRVDIGFYDVSHKRERFLCGLLNLMLDLDLLITVQDHTGYPFIDLADEIAGWAVVTTYETTRAKAKQIIQRFDDLCLDRKFHTLLFLSTVGSDAPRIDSPDSNESTTIIFWDLNEILMQIELLPMKTLEAINAYLFEYLQGVSVQPTYVLQTLPPPCDYFLEGSRDRELAELRKFLKKRTPVFIWGLGGIGKTETAIQLALQCSPIKGTYMIRCPAPPKHDIEEEDDARLGQPVAFLRETILKADFGNYCFSGMDDPRHDLEYQERLDILRTQYRGAMLLIDNLDWPGITLQDIVQEQAYHDLTALDLQLIFTTRCDAGPDIGVEIKRLPDEYLLKLMHRIMGFSFFADEELLKLIRTVAGHTLAVSLMAKIMDESWGDITPQNILDAFRKGLQNAESLPTVTSDKDQSYKQNQIYIHLQSLFDVAMLGELDRLVLQNALLIPDDGLDQDLFLRCLSNRHAPVAQSLIKRGMIQENRGLLTLHPVVREVFRSNLRPTEENCAKFLLRIQKHSDLPGDYQKNQLKQIAGVFSNASSMLLDQSGRWASFAGRLQDALGHPYEALKYNLLMLERLKNNSSVESKDMIVAYNQVGISYFALGEYEKAMQFQKLALEHCMVLQQQDNLMLANSYTNVGNTYAEMERFAEALQYHVRALEIATDPNAPTLSPIDLAQFYTNVGLTHFSLRQYNCALQNLLDALKKFSMALPQDHPDLARAYNHVGLVYDAMDDHMQALNYKLIALNIFQNVLSSEHPELARAYNSIGKTYNALHQHERALRHVTQAMVIREKILPVGHPDLAVSYNNVASTYISLGRFEKAYEYASKALELRRRYLPNQPFQLALSHRNLGLVCYDMADYRQALDHLDQAIGILERSSHKEHPIYDNTHRIRQLILEKIQVGSETV